MNNLNRFLDQLDTNIELWLNKNLSKITSNWWEELVLNTLNLEESSFTEENLRNLNLLEKLHVVDRNWFIIASSFFWENDARSAIREMCQALNFWKDIPLESITKDKVKTILEIIKRLSVLFESSNNDIESLDYFIFEVENDTTIETYSLSFEQEEEVETIEDSHRFKVGDIVALESDISVIGAVIGVAGNRYTVLMDGIPQNFYGEQLHSFKIQQANNLLSVEKARSLLTAYQINYPGNSKLYSLNSARIEFVPYQFRPALKIIKSDCPKLLIADDVGVGKTIEAGLILKEMEARSNISSVLIICPRPLVAEQKWVLEMKRFDEDFTQLSSKDLLEAISATDRDGVWPERHSKTIIPYSILNENTIMGTKQHRRLVSKGLIDLDPMPHFDLVIVDEAHTIRNSNTWWYKGVEVFCRNADAVIFLTATPLQNGNNDLYTLLNLLRPDLILDKDTFTTMSEPNRFINRLLQIVRSQPKDWKEESRKEIINILDTKWGRDVIQHNPKFEQIYDIINKDKISRQEKISLITRIEELHSFNDIINRTRRRDIDDFCIRRNLTVKVKFTNAQKELYCTLIEFEKTALTILHGDRNVQFMLCTIMRQAASCLYGLAPYMQNIVERKLNQVIEDGELYELDFKYNDILEKLLFELANKIEVLTRNLPSEDPKFQKLYEIIEEKQKDENSRVIVFSSFRYTLGYIKAKLEKLGIRVGLVDGSVPDEERYAMRKRFKMDRLDEHAIDVLLFSEIGCEGLDYQFCDTMINYDLPWNPMRIEQRIGRIDRRGQKSNTVKIYNMIIEDTIDETIYDKCLGKIGVFESSIGDCANILGDISEQIIKIMFNSELTNREKHIKLEQIADNEVMRMQELKKLEQEEKSLYGFDLSKYVIDKDVQNAENEWISSYNIQKLVCTFLNEFLGKGEYIKGRSEIKNLRLSVEKKHKLLEHLRNINIMNTNSALRFWKGYLKSNIPNLKITFDSNAARDNGNVTFLTQMHPLVKQAAFFESSKFPCEISIISHDSSIPKGEYAFLIYAWNYVGLHSDIKLIAISDDNIVQEKVLGMICDATDCTYDNTKDYHALWNEMDSLHYKKWKIEKEEYIYRAKEECNYRLEQQSHSFRRREAILKDQILKASDEKIERMRVAQLEKLKTDFEYQNKNIQKMVSQTEIKTNLLIKGKLLVKE